MNNAFRVSHHHVIVIIKLMGAGLKFHKLIDDFFAKLFFKVAVLVLTTSAIPSLEHTRDGTVFNFLMRRHGNIYRV